MRARRDGREAQGSAPGTLEAVFREVVQAVV